MKSNFSSSSALSFEASALASLTDEQQVRLTEVLDRYLSALEEDAPLSPDELYAAHPDLADILRVHFRSLEDLHSMAAGFGSPSSSVAVDDTPAAPADRDTKRIGDFELLREIGRGGMGVVYEARQISLDRRVAVKLLPFAAVLDSKQIARFKNEAQAAAHVQHPNIVPVFAIGVERGVHYYAMQMIDGQPLDQALRELRAGRRQRQASVRSLAVETLGQHAGDASLAPSPSPPVASDTQDDRQAATRSSVLTAAASSRREYFETVLRLGIQAADALHSAHEYGVVHRDIKPSNLLGDAEGKLWVTDFGLARCQRDVSLTKTGDVVGTMRYMSPEQATGQSALVDQRTDIYSLGVTLYELLCLRPAYPEENSAALLRQLDRDEPPRLRQIQPDIPADLETVVQKAMAKSREDRYETARQLAEDLRRVLEGKPTHAKPPTFPERVWKWARRHQRTVSLGMAASILSVIALVVATLMIAREKSRAERNLARANRYFHDARGMLDRFGLQLADKLSDVPGAEQVRQELLQETLEYYQGFLADVQGDPHLQLDMALTAGQVAALTEAIGSSTEAVLEHQRTLRLFEELVASRPGNLDQEKHLARAHNNLALALHRAGRIDDARQHFAEAIRLQERLTAKLPDDRQVTGDLAMSLSNLGLLQNETGQPIQAQASFRSAIELLGQLPSSVPDGSTPQRQMAAAYNNLAATYLSAAPDEALRLHEAALGYQRTALAGDANDLDLQRDIALTLNNLGAAQARRQEFAKALNYYREAIDIQEKLTGLVPAQHAYQRDLGVSHNNRGLVYSRAQRAADAEAEFRQALTIQEELIQSHPDDLALQSSLGGVYNNLGIVLEETGRLDEAADAFAQAIEHQKIAFDRATAVDRFRAFLSRHYYNHGRVLRRLSRFDQAVAAAIARRDLWQGDAEHLLSVAEELAAAGEQMQAADSTDQSRNNCIKLTVETLEQVLATGHTLPRTFADKPPFTALRQSPNFASFIEKLP